jgi:high-affinity Fe2+/Pb2+ permease
VEWTQLSFREGFKRMGTIASGTLAVAMIAAFLLTAGGIQLIVRGEYRKQGMLMLLAALVLVGNVLVWTI